MKDKSIIKHIPNALTVGRLVLTVVFLAMVIYGGRTEDPSSNFLLVAFVLFVVTGLTDIVDGKLARMFNVVSKFGRIADPLADKFLVCGAFICFAIVGQPTMDSFGLSETVMHFIRWGAVAAIIAREVYVTVIRHIAESRGINFAATASGKFKMFAQTFGIGTVLIKWAYVSAPWGDWFAATVYIILISSTIYSGLRASLRPINK